MSSWARPGVKCVCINAGNTDRAFRWRGDGPVVGQTYTIRKVWSHSSGVLVMDFEELRRNPLASREWGEEVGYAVFRFRPLITKTQEDDVALFRGLLTGAPVGVDA